MKSYSHIRSKSDTDFNFDKTSLDITHYNLKQFREDTNKDSTITRKALSNSNSLSRKRKQSSFLTGKRKFFTNQFQNSKTIENMDLFFNNFLVKIIKFKKKYDQAIIEKYIASQKFYLNILLTLLRLHIIKYIREIKDDNTELKKKMDKFDSVVSAIITIKPEEYYHELKTMILNEFDKSKYELTKVILSNKEKKDLDEKDHKFQKVISAISQATLFILSKISFRLDYYSLTMNCLVQKIKSFIINFIDYNSQEDEKFLSPGEKKKRLKTMHLIEHVMFLDKAFTEQFYSDKVHSLQLDAFSSFGRFILTNLIQVCGKCEKVAIKKNLSSVELEQQPIIKKILYNYVLKRYLKGQNEKDKSGFQIKLEKFFRMFFTLKLLSWKNNSIKLETSKKTTEICRICEVKIPITDFFYHINYCKEQKVFYELMKNVNESLCKPIMDFETIVDGLPGSKEKIKMNTQKNMYKATIQFDNSVILKRNEETKKNFDFFYELPCFKFLFEKNETEKQKYKKLKELISLFSFEIEIPFDFYEKNPQKFPLLFSLIYLAFHIYYTNKNNSSPITEINQIFAPFLHSLLRKLIGTEYILAIKQSRTKSNSNFRLSKTFHKLCLNEMTPKANQDATPSSPYTIDGKKSTFSSLLDNFKSKINYPINSCYLSPPLTYKPNRKESDNSNCTFSDQSNDDSSNKKKKKPLNTFLLSNSKGTSILVKKDSNKSSPIRSQRKIKTITFDKDIDKVASIEREPHTLSNTKQDGPSSFFFTKSNTAFEPSIFKDLEETKPRKSLFVNSNSQMHLNYQYMANVNDVGILQKKANKEVKQKKVSGDDSSSDQSLSINYDEDSIIITSPKKQVMNKQKRTVDVDDTQKETEERIWEDIDSDDSSDRSDSDDNSKESYQGNVINTIFNVLVNNKNEYYTNLNAGSKDEEVSSSSSQSKDGLGPKDNFVIESIDKPIHQKDNSFGKYTLSPNMSTLSTSINDFQLLIPLAKGGYGRVDIYKKIATGDLYAIKTVDISSMKEKNLSSSLKNETIILNEINSDYVVKCYFIFKDEINYYYVMEYMPGGDLLGLLNANILDQQTIKFITAEVLLALTYLHSMNIIHKDIKPENILISKNCHFKVTDFGLSESEIKFNKYSIIEIGDNNEMANSESYLHDNKILGTLNYMAPEMFTGEHDITFAVDYWALGVLIFELYTNKVPFFNSKTTETKNNIMNCNINWSVIDNEEIRSNYTNVDDAMDLIKKLLVINPEERWGDNNIEDIKSHKFFDKFNWSDIKSMTIGEIYLHVKKNISEVNKKIKERPKEDRKVFHKAETLKETEENFYFKRGRTNSDNFSCKRVDNLYGKSKDVINTQIKLNYIKINEDNTDSLFEDLK